MKSLINLGKIPSNFKFKSSPRGEEKKTVYKYVYSEKHGCPRRVENGQVNIRDLIQSYADDVDFKSIGKMLVDTRDNVVSHFTDINGDIVDVTGQPRNIHEFEALHNRMKSQFESLPDDLKSLFGGSFDGYRKAYNDGTMGSIFETYTKSLQVVETKHDDTEGGADK